MPKSLHAWQPVGQDVVRDSLYGRLGNNGGSGRTIVAGATNSIAVHEQNNQTILFAGTVNGGIFSRVLSEEPEKNKWSWVSNPSDGYVGSQGIGELAVSKNGKLIAVGQGNPSNYSGISTISHGLLIGALGRKGSIEWPELSADHQQQLYGHNIRSLHWLGSQAILATSFDPGRGGSIIRASIGRDGGFDQIDITDVSQLNLVSATQDKFSVLAGSGGESSDEYANKILLVKNAALKNLGNNESADFSIDQLSGQLYQSLLREYDEESATIRRVDLAQKLINQRLVVFVGLSREDSSNGDFVYRVDRLEVHPSSGEVVGVKTFRTQKGEIGTNQASNDVFYGNFSFSIDPRDDMGSGVFLGGNHFGGSPEEAGISYGGGLVYVDFRPDKPAITHRLYGPRVQESEQGIQSLIFPINPGQPHADSRNIAFANDAENPVLYQVDDGGVWSLALRKTPGSGFQSDQFWRPLSSPGLNAFEVMMTDWHAQSNGVVASYQDNAASYAISGEAYANNLWSGDGEIAVIDDAGDKSFSRAYLSSQEYFKDGLMARLKINSSGFLEGYDVIDFLLQDAPDSKPLLWDHTFESLPTEIPFIRPFELNPYREGSIVMVGTFNIYEAVSIDSAEYPNSIIFRSLLTPRPDLTVSALDNHGNHPGKDFQGMYAAIFENGHPQIIGRDAGNDNYFLNESIYSGASDPDPRIAHNVIVDLAHRPNSDGNDDLYWLQGGRSLLYSYLAPISDQVLRFKLRDGELGTFSPAELGIEVENDDPFKLQSIVFVPSKNGRADSLVVSGLTGHWISELSDEGIPLGFEKMNWIKPYKPESPNVYPTSVKYDPKDDLLIAGTLGKGSWIYRFSKDETQRSEPQELLHTSDVNFTQFLEHDLDKRNNQRNSNFTLQIDRRMLPDPEQDVRVKFILRDWSQWGQRMEYVSPLFFFANSELGEMNLLDPVGVEAFGGKMLKGDRVAIPFIFEDGNSTIPVHFTAKEFSFPEDDVILKYKVKHFDGPEASRSKITMARPSRDSSEFEVHGVAPDNDSIISSGAPPLARSNDSDGYRDANDDWEIFHPITQDC